MLNHKCIHSLICIGMRILTLRFLVINGERAAMYAPDFKGKGIQTRRMVLKDIVDKYSKEESAPGKERVLKGIFFGVCVSHSDIRGT